MLISRVASFEQMSTSRSALMIFETRAMGKTDMQLLVEVGLVVGAAAADGPRGEGSDMIAEYGVKKMVVVEGDERCQGDKVRNGTSV